VVVVWGGGGGGGDEKFTITFSGSGDSSR